MMKKTPMKAEFLDMVAGGVDIGIPTGNENTTTFKSEERDRMWEVIKTRQEWEFKTIELEQSAKKMWIDAGLDLTKSILGEKTVLDVISGLIKKPAGASGAADD